MGGFATRYRSELDEAVAREFDALNAKLNALLGLEHNLNDGTHNIPGLSPIGEDGRPRDGSTEKHHWNRGPWTFDDPDGFDAHVAFIRPPNLPAGTYNDFNPEGLQTCVGIEVEPDGDITITGVQAPSPLRKRVMIIENSDSTNNITLSHDSASSAPGNRFLLPGDVDVVMAPHQVIWLRYDLGVNAWFAAITPHESGGLSGGSGDTTNVTPSIFFRDWDAWTISAGGAPTEVVSAMGSTLVSNAVTPTTDYVGGYPYHRIQVAANTAATVARIVLSGTPPTNGSNPQLSTGFTMDMWIRVSDSLTDIRHWMGMFTDTTITATTDTTPSANFIAFRFSSTAGDTKWTAVTRDGTTTTTQVVGSDVTTNTIYHLRIRVPAGGLSAFFSVDEGTEVEMTAAFPATTVVLYPSETVAKPATGASLQKRFGHNKMVLMWSDPTPPVDALGLDAAVTCIFDGAGEELVSGKTVYVRVPYDMEIAGWDIVGDQSGSAVVKVYNDSYANYPPDASDEISGSGERPTLSSQDQNQDTNLTTWTVQITKGSYLAFHLHSCSTVEWVGVQLYGNRI